MGYANVLSPELTLVGRQHWDTIFHASVAGVFAKFGIVSTGLDGLVPIKYHFLSQLWFGMLGRWLDIAPIHAYYLGMQIVAVPLLFYSLGTAVYALWQPREVTSGIPLSCVVPLSALFIVDSYSWFSYLISESHCLAVALLLLSVTILTQMAEQPARSISLTWVSLFFVGAIGTSRKASRSTKRAWQVP